MLFSKKIPAILFSLFLLFTSNVVSQSSWRNVNAGTDVDIVSVHFTSSGKGWIAGDDGFLASTTDGGKSWTRFPLNTTENISEIYFRNDDNGYLVAGRKMFLTRDGGKNWQETVLFRASDFPNAIPEFLSIKFADKKRGVVVGSVLNRNEEVIDSLVMKTEDEGQTWQRIRVPSKTELFHLDFDGSNRGWIVGDKGIILATTNGGTSWTQQRSGTQRALYNVDFRDSKAGYAVGGGGTILRTENGGDDWELITTNFPSTFMRVDFADDKNGWIVGHRGTVLRSGDKGRTWVKQESGTENSLFGLYIVKRYGWAVGADGTVIEHLK